MNRSSSLVIGLIFIVVGLLLLLNRFNLFYVTWSKIYPVLLVIAGLYFFYKAFRGKSENAFWGTFFLLMGSYFLLQNFHIIHRFQFYEFWPVFIVALGVSFIILFLFKPSDWALLIPGSILTFFGAIILFHTLDFSYMVIRFAQKFWPLVLVIIGIGLITSSLIKKK